MNARYIRVSTTSQNSDGQKKHIKRWLKGQGRATKDKVLKLQRNGHSPTARECGIARSTVYTYLDEVE